MLVQIFRCETSVWWYIIKRGWPRRNWFDFWRGCGTGRVRDEWAAAPRHHSGLIFSAVSTSALFCLWMDGWIPFEFGVEFKFDGVSTPGNIGLHSENSKRSSERRIETPFSKCITQAIYLLHKHLEFSCFLTSLLSHMHRCEHLESRQAGSSCDDCLTVWLVKKKHSLILLKLAGIKEEDPCDEDVIRWTGCTQRAWRWKQIHVFATDFAVRGWCGQKLSGVRMWLNPHASLCGAVKRKKMNFQKDSEEPWKACRRFGGRSFRIKLFLCCRLTLIFAHILLIWGWICLQMQNSSMFRNRLL